MPVRPLSVVVFLRVLVLHHCGLIHVCVLGLLAYKQSLLEGLRTERRWFHMTFATDDQRKGA